MLKNIVVPLDGSNFSWCAAHHALDVAHAYQAAIHGVSITDVKVIEGKVLDDLIEIVSRLNIHIGPMPGDKVDRANTSEVPSIDAEMIQDLYQDQGRLLLGELERKCKAAGVAYQSSMPMGMIPGVICRVANESKAELIVLGKRGLNSKWTGPLLGATTESVVRMAKRPVLLAQETYVPIETVYVAYDGDLLSVRALRFAADLCARCGWKMRVVSVFDSPERCQKVLQEASEITELHNVKIEVVARSGEVVEQILEATAPEPNSLIVLGAHSHRLLGLTLGNVSERVMRRAPQPVLLYRPID
jgi:nucleotide-binding universal stress UspA family protein